MNIETNCENCMNYTYDEEYDEYVCIANIDEDEYYRVMSNRRCPYFSFRRRLYNSQKNKCNYKTPPKSNVSRAFVHCNYEI
ncbi:MAG: DUF6472 family protein [Clostridiales bacterium]|nr:MAG: DUF6472 family protein [Clostridiales bacterium]